MTAETTHTIADGRTKRLSSPEDHGNALKTQFASHLKLALEPLQNSAASPNSVPQFKALCNTVRIQLANSNSPTFITTIVSWLDAISSCAGLLVPSARELVQVTLQLVDWSRCQMKEKDDFSAPTSLLEKSVLAFVLSIASSCPFFVSDIYSALMGVVQPRLDPEDQNKIVIISPGTLDFAHHVLSCLAMRVPASHPALHRLLISSFPHHKQPTQQLLASTSMLLRVCDYCKTLRPAVYEVLLDRAISLDLELTTRTELAEDGSSAEDDESETGTKLDGMVSLLFRNIELVCTRGKEQCDDMMTLYFNLFDKTMIKTDKLHCAPYLLFYLTSYSADYPLLFIRYLAQKIMNCTEHLVERAAAVGYLASYVSRASFLPHSTLRVACDLLLQFLKDVLTRHAEPPIDHMKASKSYSCMVSLKNLRPTQSSPDLIHRPRAMGRPSSNPGLHCSTPGTPRRAALPPVVALFYACCQALMYVFCFRLSELKLMWRDAERDQDVECGELGDYVPSWPLESIMSSQWTPLSICSLSVCDEFINTYKSTFKNRPEAKRWASIVNERKRTLATPTRKRIAREEDLECSPSMILRDIPSTAISFFPFDPYPISGGESDKFVIPLYVRWKSCEEVEAEGELSESQADMSELEEVSYEDVLANVRSEVDLRALTITDKIDVSTLVTTTTCVLPLSIKRSRQKTEDVVTSTRVEEEEDYDLQSVPPYEPGDSSDEDDLEQDDMFDMFTPLRGHR